MEKVSLKSKINAEQTEIMLRFFISVFRQFSKNFPTS